MGATESKEIESKLRRSTCASASFPTEFGLFYSTLSGGLKLSLGQQKDQPFYILSLPNGWYAEMILYAGTSASADPLAVVRNTGKVGQHDAIELAPLRPGMPLIHEEMKFYSHGWQARYSFAAPVGPDGHRERLEWRSSKTGEVQSLGEKSSGWELVRLDNKEDVVAVWSEAKLKMSLHHTATFRFVGAGADGQMGIGFAVMAVTSFLRIWQRTNRTYVSSGIAAGVAS